jgi:hypothetical protein
MNLATRDKRSSKKLNLHSLTLQNIRSARRDRILTVQQVVVLRALTEDLQLSVALGDLKLLDSGWYVTHSGLMRLARRNRCAGVQVRAMREFCDPGSCHWVFKATAYKSPRSRGFVGYGDADPSNVSPLVRGAEMRVAETRAVNRALRKAYGIGLCSVEELGWSPRAADPVTPKRHDPVASGNNGHHNGEHRLRDRLCLLIRQHKLDANLVKAYAADYCGTDVLKEAKRDLIEAFVSDLEERATKDREGLICHLNTYSTSSQEATI